MIVLGWHGGIIREHQDAAPGWSTHDGSAVIMRDGELVCALEEERINRIKHSNFFPAHSIAECLRVAGISFEDVDVVAMNFMEYTRDVFPRDSGLPSVNHFLEHPDQRSFSVREMVSELFFREFGAHVLDKLFFCNHHDAHLWSTFAPSGFPDALAVSIDGFGDRLSGSVALCDSGALTVLRRHTIEQSLGTLYRDFIRVLGYNRFDEYKAMGLAPYGDPERFRSVFHQIYKLLPEGQFELIPIEDRWSLLYDEGLVKQARRVGEKFEDVHKDFAAGLQDTLETIVFHFISYFQQKTESRNLCLAGGVAHNCTLNGKLLRSGMFDQMYVQPASHDAGGSLGAAIAAFEARGDRSCRRRIRHVFLGRDIGDNSEVRVALEAWGPVLDIHPTTDPSVDAAHLLAEGKVIGWVQGRSEFGPRALGHRSIVADPRPLENWQRINRIIKERESYRPFAPAILDEDLPAIVELPRCKADLSFMTFTLPVQADKRGLLGATTHVDGSCRVQAVSREFNIHFWNLIREFKRITGMSAILNTSFNNNVEPIVDSIDDAVACLLTTGLDAMVVGKFLVRRKDFLSAHCYASSLELGLRANKKLVKRRTLTVEGQSRTRFTIESTASRNLDRPSVDVPEWLFHSMTASDNKLIIGDLTSVKAAGAQDEENERLKEIFALWKLRAIRIRPSLP